MDDKKIERNEKNTFIQNKSYKYGYNILVYGILLDCIYRSIRFNENLWELFILIIVAGSGIMAYQYKQKMIKKSSLKSLLLTALACIILAWLILFKIF